MSTTIITNEGMRKHCVKQLRERLNKEEVG